MPEEPKALLYHSGTLLKVFIIAPKGTPFRLWLGVIKVVYGYLLGARVSGGHRVPYRRLCL